MTTARGKKVTCADCGAKFYDMNKFPPECPKCKKANGKLKSNSSATKKSGSKSTSKKAAKDTSEVEQALGLICLDADSLPLYMSSNLAATSIKTDLKRKKGWFLVSMKADAPERIGYKIQIPEIPVAGLRKYLMSKTFDGVGMKTADDFLSAAGESVFGFLDNTDDSSEGIGDFDPEQARKIQETWQDNEDLNALQLFLHQLDLDLGVIRAIEYNLGSDIVRIISEEPFALVDEIPRFTFEDARGIIDYLKINIPRHQHISAAADYRLRRIERERGHTSAPMDRLVPDVSKLVAYSDDEVQKVLSGLQEQFPVVGLEDQAMVSRQGSFDRDGEIIEGILQLLESDSSKYAEEDFDSDRIDLPGTLELSENQSAALSGAVKHPVFLITGGPGTGKTTLVVAIVRALKKLGRNVTLCAPTGRAAKRLEETPGLKNFKPTTIHSLLAKMRPGSSRKIDTLIVDESSMIDVDLMVRLLGALDKSSSLIMIGDADQLPPVGAGQVFKDMLASAVVPKMRLLNNFRQEEASKINVAAADIIAGRTPALRNEASGSDFVFIEVADPRRQLEKVVDLYLNTLPKKYGLSGLSDIQILSPMKKGSVGITAINAIVQKKLTGRGMLVHSRSFAGQSVKFFEGDKIIQTSNNYNLNVMNGDIGILKGKSGSDVMAEFNGEQVKYDTYDIRDVDLAYAISIHKSQGSEYPAVIIPISSEHQFMLARNLLYTAVTRGKRQVFCVGESKSFEKGIASAWKDFRYTLLEHRLKSDID